MSLQGPTHGRSSGNCTGFEGLLCPCGVPLPSGLVFKFILPPRGTHLEGKLTKSHPSPILLVAVQLLSDVRVFVTPWTAARQASLSITNSRSSLTLMSIYSVMPSNHLILCHSLLLLPSVFPSIRIFPNELAPHIRWYWISALALVFPMRQFFTSGSQSIGASASASVLPMSIQD